MDATHPVADSPAFLEMRRLWDQFRTADLNVRYYGMLAQRRKAQNARFQIAITTLSLFAAVTLAAPELRRIDTLAIVAAVSGGASAILAGALPFLGWDEDAKKYTFLNRSYQIVENQIKEVLATIRRNGLNDESLGRSKQLLDSMSRLQGFDEEEYSLRSQKEKAKFSAEVNKAYPSKYVWNNL